MEHLDNARTTPLAHQPWHGRRQVSWLAGLRRLPDLPGFPVVRVGSKLAAHSCGGSHGIRAKRGAHRVPFHPIEQRLREPPTIATLGQTGRIVNCGTIPRNGAVAVDKNADWLVTLVRPGLLDLI